MTLSNLKTTCALGLLVAALAGCGGDPPAEGGASAPETAAARSDDPCALLTSADAQDALGSAPGDPVRQDNGALRMCQYTAEPSGEGLEAVAGAPSAGLSIFSGTATRDTLASNTAGGTPVPGVGEVAAELGTAIYFLKGERLYGVDLSGEGMTAASRADLAKKIADRI